jgi:RNA polymerase sigma-70 factor (ECF subfamily)
MPDADRNDDVLERAIAGERAALDGLLAAYYPRLAAYIAPKLPDDLQGTLALEDVLQEAFLDVFQDISSAKAENGPSFYRWLVAITEHRMLDLIRAARAAKRGGGWSPLDAVSASVVGMLEQLAVNTRTPSTSAAGKEAISAVQSGMELLPEDYREALRLRYIEGLAVAETATRMGRTELAVQMLCHRALQRLAALMGSASRFLSRNA